METSKAHFQKVLNRFFFYWVQLFFRILELASRDILCPIKMMYYSLSEEIFILNIVQNTIILNAIINSVE